MRPNFLDGQSLIASNADIASSASVGRDTKVWSLTQIREDVSIGIECVIGRGVYVGSGVKIGNRCKIQNDALLYEPAELGDGVFIGPAAVLTNDAHPRAVTPSGRLKVAADWHAVGVVIASGASIGARAVCVAPVTVGAWAMVGAGAVVVDNVPDHAIVVGVPARQIGWVGRAGHRLEEREPGRWQCPTTDELYVHHGDGLRVVEEPSRLEPARHRATSSLSETGDCR